MDALTVLLNDTLLTRTDVDVSILCVLYVPCGSDGSSLDSEKIL